MEEQRKQPPHNDGGQREGGQRISVRPGNFNPPPQKNAGGESKKNRPLDGRNGQESNDQSRHSGGHGRHGRGRHKHGKPHPQQGNAQPQQGAKQEKSKTPQAASVPAHTAPVVASENNRHKQNHHNRRRNDERRKNEKSAPKLSDTLQRELDEEFNTPTLSPLAPLKKEKQAEATAVDSDEFAVDIATAAYLTEDIPCGFPTPDGKAVEVVGVRFRHAGKVYFFAPGEFKFRIGEAAIVDTARGPEIGNIVLLNRKVAEKNMVQPLRPVLRRATKEDLARHAENQKKECEALRVCGEKIAAHKLDMHLVDAQYTFDNSKLLFYFTSEGRVDFRELVRELAGVFHTRIELRQIGIRDESRLIGGLGMCGRPFCCTTYISDFGQVSIKMAKEQGLSINTSKISGCCGRLMCCLRYEHASYAEEIRRTPAKDCVVETPDGTGVVVDNAPIAGTVKVRLNATPEEPPRTYHRDTVSVVAGKRAPRAENAQKPPENGAEGKME